MSETNSNIVNENCEQSPQKSPNKKNSLIKGFIEQLELAVIVFCVIVIIFSFFARTCQVSGDSMNDTLLDKETVLITNLFYTPQRNDIIVFHQTGDVYNEPIVKRIIAVEGDTVDIKYGADSMRVTVTDSKGNSTVLEEDYIRYDYQTYADASVYVEEGTVFVMGDNRSHSADSRSNTIGLVDTRRILGKVFFRITPFSRIGSVQ